MLNVWNSDWMLSLPSHWFDYVLSVDEEEMQTNQLEWHFLNECSEVNRGKSS